MAARRRLQRALISHSLLCLGRQTTPSAVDRGRLELIPTPNSAETKTQNLPGRTFSLPARARAPRVIVLVVFNMSSGCRWHSQRRRPQNGRNMVPQVPILGQCSLRLRSLHCMGSVLWLAILKRICGEPCSLLKVQSPESSIFVTFEVRVIRSRSRPVIVHSPLYAWPLLLNRVLAKLLGTFRDQDRTSIRASFLRNGAVND